MLDTSCRIEMLGGLRVRWAESIVTQFETRKTAALLAYLAYFPDRGHLREMLVEVLWPEEDPDATRARLRQSLATIRRIFEPAVPAKKRGSDTSAVSIVIADRVDVRLNSTILTTDTAEFERSFEKGRRSANASERVRWLTHAADLYRGELLPGYYEDWIGPERERLARANVDALCGLADALAMTGDPAQAIERARQATAADPLREESHQLLMRLFANAGQSAAALRAYREMERILRQEFDVAPSPESRNLAQRIEAAGVGGRSEAASSEILIANSPPVTSPSQIAHITRSELSQVTTPSAELAEPACHEIGRRPSLNAGIDSVGGALPLDSGLYIVRPADAAFDAAILRAESIVLVKGPRQVGKSSLLARGFHQAREAGARVVLTDLQRLTSAHLESADTLFYALAEAIADDLGMDDAVESTWRPRSGWSVNFDRFLRRSVLPSLSCRLVWGLDEVDRLFGHPFASEVFGLFRSWHNERSLNPAAPWRQLTLAMAYATEAHLFISDLNQSPFNVGMRLTLEDFTLEQVAELNDRYATLSHSGKPPVPPGPTLTDFYTLVGGNPYLVQRGLHELAVGRMDLIDLEAEGSKADGIFHDSLRRIMSSLNADPALREAMRCVIRLSHGATKSDTLSEDAFFRLRSAGLITGDSPDTARPRCRLYGDFLARHLP